MRKRRKQGRLMRFIFSVCIGLATLFSPFALYARDISALSPQQFSTVDTICTKIVGLRQGESYFASCRSILARSLMQKSLDRTSTIADRTCSQRGLPPGSAAFSTCVLDNESESFLPNKDGTGTTYSDGNAPAIESFYSVPFSVRWNRERYACAALGLTPEGGAFDECVSGLDGSFVPNPN
jgi:hypothetical protein